MRKKQKRISDITSIERLLQAGNDGMNTDRKASYPSCYPNNNIISVASIKPDGTISGFSNYGLKTVDLAAPGSYIWSSTPGNLYSK